MEAGILQKMDAARNAADPSGPNRNRGPILIGILLLLLLIPMYCTLTEVPSQAEEPVLASSPQASPVPQSSGTQQKASPSAVQPSAPNQAVTIPATISPGSDLREDKTIPEKDRSTTPRQHPQTDKPTDRLLSPIEINPAIDTNRLLETADRSQRPSAVASAPLSPSRNDFSSAADRSLPFDPQQDSASWRTTTPLPHKSYLVHRAEKARQIPALSAPSLHNAMESEPAERASRRWAILTGVADWEMGYGTELPESASYESPLLSWQSGISYLHPLPRQYTLLSGLQWQRLESRLDWSTAVDDYQVTLRDTILRVETNALTGKESKVRGDVTLTVPANRVVRHHNQIQLLQIPLAVGKTWLYRNWQADLLIGGAFTVYTYHKVRTLYREELLDYAGPKTDLIDNRWKFQALLAGRLTYRINRHFGITTGIQWQRSLGNWSTEAAIVQRPRIVNVQLGFTYSGQ